MSPSAKRRPFIAGNWKLFKTAAETVQYIRALKKLMKKGPEVDVALAPPFTALESAVKAASGSTIAIAAQNVFWEEEGAFTGEIAPGMLKALSVGLAIVGHSERRQYFGETDQTVNRRIKAALAAGLDAIVCIGETLEEREGKKTKRVLSSQISKGLAGLTREDGLRLTIAYEPVWAIGTGKTATPDMAQDAHQYIRRQLEKIFDKKVANSVRIQYGGSVKPDNAAELMAQPDIDGALVGGASLKPDVFFKIINFKGA
ncbi:MAG: triose-phosphate isomerase [Proteobacteria bacterium]|nr:triose-phosphate isomerase [Pseudomonadota bacterium]